MRTARELKNRLLAGYLLFGAVNVLLISLFTYLGVRSTLIERAENHMISVRTLAQEKLLLYLDNLKAQARQNEHRLITSPETERVCVKRKGWIEGNCPVELFELPADTFLPGEKNTFYLKLVDQQQETIWHFNHEGFNNVLYQREGLGGSGEIYLVGKDYGIKSASRFITEWPKLNLANESVRRGLAREQGASISEDYRGIKVISAYSWLQKDQLEFVLLAEIDISEVLTPLYEGIVKLIFLGVLLILITVFVAIYVTRKNIQEVDAMTNELSLLNEEKVRRYAESAIQVMRVQEEERERIAYNLHDSVGQYLTALKWGLSQLKLELRESSSLPKLKELETLSDSIIQEIRSISSDIMPSLIRDFGIFHAINEYLEKQKKIYSLQINFACHEALPQLPLKKGFQLNLYRMVQEFIQNTIKHSQANSASLAFSLENNQLIMIYSDNGIGMADEARYPRSLSYRAQLFNGKMERLHSETGLTFKITFNLRDVADGENEGLSAG